MQIIKKYHLKSKIILICKNEKIAKYYFIFRVPGAKNKISIAHYAICICIYINKCYKIQTLLITMYWTLVL